MVEYSNAIGLWPIYSRVYRQVGVRQAVSDNWLDLSGLTHPASDRLFVISGEDNIGGRQWACVISKDFIVVISNFRYITVLDF